MGENAAARSSLLADNLLQLILSAAILPGERQNDFNHIREFLAPLFRTACCKQLCMFFSELVVQGRSQLVAR